MGDKQSYLHTILDPLEIRVVRQSDRPRLVVQRKLPVNTILFTHVGSVVVASGDHAVPFEVLPSFDRVASVTAETTSVTAERKFFGGYELIETAVGGYAHPVGERTGGTESLYIYIYLYINL